MQRRLLGGSLHGGCVGAMAPRGATSTPAITLLGAEAQLRHTRQRYHLDAIASRSADRHRAGWVLGGLVVLLWCWLAACAHASTIAYLNTSNNDVYVADSTGGDATDVASGVTSPSLANNGDLYALNSAGTAADEFRPGIGADGSTSLPGGTAFQLAVQPNQGSLMWSAGAEEGDSDANVLNLATGASQTIKFGLNGHWASFGRVMVPTYLSLGEDNPFGVSTVKVDSPGAVRTAWYPQPLLEPLTWFNNVFEYAPNPQGTLAAAAYTGFIPSEGVYGGLVIFPINPITLHPTISYPLLNGCQINNYYSDSGAFTEAPVLQTGDTFAWAPDGLAIAYDDWNADISTVTVGLWNSDCSQTGPPQQIIANATEPSWGPSDNRDFPAPGS